MLNTACVSDLRNRVPETSCPACGQPHLEFSMRCDLGTTECLFVARCDRCHTLFNVDLDSFPPPCARCTQELEFVVLSCSLTSHSCHYELRCPRCDRH
jgi:hypothetical protein